MLILPQQVEDADAEEGKENPAEPMGQQIEPVDFVVPAHPGAQGEGHEDKNIQKGGHQIAGAQTKNPEQQWHNEQIGQGKEHHQGGPHRFRLHPPPDGADERRRDIQEDGDAVYPAGADGFFIVFHGKHLQGKSEKRG